MATEKFLQLALAGSLSALLISGPAYAQSADKMMKSGDSGHSAGVSRTFSLLDTDGDGKISLAEIRAEQARLTAAADLDGDGKLSVDEFRRRGWWFQKLHTTTLFDLMDANGDQVLTAEEIASPSARWFKRYDKDADGGITTEEVPHFKRSGRGHRKHR
ncbi:MAG: Ca2+-binding EF-hand superfamily protein [Paracoccaceae bacterium]|jgi:Ca2+-binding EF-hand superfamily protein